MPDLQKNKNGEWDLLIVPKKGWLDINLRELFRYRDLIWLLVRRDFVVIYKQTVLGPLWFILQPLFTTIIFTFVFGGLAKIPTDGVPQTLFYYGGNVLWGYFSACLMSSSDTFIANSSLFGKIYFPRIAIPLSKIFSNLISVLIQFLALAAFYLYYSLSGSPVRPNVWAITLPLLLLQLAILGTGFGMIISSLTTKYRDLRHLVSFGIQLWMYATPIVYPLSQVPDRFRWIFIINPLTAPVENFRYAFYGVGGTNLLTLMVSAVSSLFIIFLGLILFNHSEQSFIDVV